MNYTKPTDWATAGCAPPSSGRPGRTRAAVTALATVAAVGLALGLVAVGLGVLDLSGAGTGSDGQPPDATGVVQRGAGTFSMAGGGTRPVGAGGQRLRYRVEVEDGIRQDAGEFARWVDRVLADPRGWTAGGQWSFQRSTAGPTDFVVRLASPDTVDEICGRYGLETQGEVSCRGDENVVINLKRWLLAIPAFNGDVEMYRHTVVNHEVGHFLGHDHAECPGKGQPAPVMQTMIYGMHGCRPNGWPFPDEYAAER